MERIAERYEVTRELGRGGMGRVLLARDAWLDRPVAIKTLLDGADLSSAERFALEARLTGRLTHPHIVALHDLGVDGGARYLAMALVEGSDFEDLLASEVPPPLARSVEVLLKVAEAVSFAHGRGILHRDLKPANVMVGARGEVLVLDWGLAKDLRAQEPEPERPDIPGRSDDAQLTQEGSVLGTPAYMAPEQADDPRAVDERADVYALGAILYRILAGAPPFSGSTLQVIAQLLKGEPPRPSSLREDVPPALEALALAAMRPELEARIPSAQAFAGELQAWLEGRPLGVYEESVGEALRRMIRRNRPLIATSLIAGLLVAVALAGALIAALPRLGEARREVAQAEADTSAAEASQREAAERLSGELASAREGLRDARFARFLSRLEARLGRAVTWSSEAADIAPDAPLEAALAELLGAARPLGLAADQSAGLALTRRFAALGVPADRIAEAQLRIRRITLGRALLFAPSEVIAAVGPDDPPELALLRLRALMRLRRRFEASETLAAPGPVEQRALKAAFEAQLAFAPALVRLAAYEAALAEDPSRAWLWSWWAACAFELGRFDEAEAALARARLAEPQDPLPTLIEAEFGGYPVIADFEASWKPIFMLCDELRPVMRPHYRLARLWYAGGTYGDNPDPRDFEGSAATIREHEAEAWAGFLKTLEATAHERPDRSPELLRVECRGALKTRRLDVAEAAAQRLLRLEAECADAQATLARVAVLREEPARALPLAEAALAADPEHTLALRAKGEALLALGRPEEAIAPLRRAAPRLRDHEALRALAEALLGAAQGSEREARLAEAAQVLREAISLDPLDDFMKSYRAHPTRFDDRNHSLMSRVREAQGRLPEALLHAHRALWFRKQSHHTLTRGPAGSAEIWRVVALFEQLGLSDAAADYRARAEAVDAARR